MCTKGEWKYGEDRDGRPCVALYFPEQMSRVHAIIARVFGKDVNEAKANAQLIASAPDMYKALRVILEAEESGKHTELTEYEKVLAQEALAKADGK